MFSCTTPEPITVTLTTAGARVRLAASDRQETIVSVEPLDGASKSDLRVAEHTKVGFADGALSIETKKPGAKRGSVAITIELPAGSGLVLNTAWTDVHADGVLGDCELKVASGQVELDRVAAVRGRLVSGAVVIGHIAGNADVEGGTGGLRIGEVEGVLRYQGSTGQVRIGHARSDLDLSGSSGGFDLDRAEGGVIAKGADCPIRIGRLTHGPAELLNASGGIEVGIEGAASVDAASTKGSVRNSVSARGGHEVKVYARTRRDDIVLHSVA